MTSTSSQYSRRCARPFNRRQFLDRVFDLDSNVSNQGSVTRTLSMDEAFKMVASYAGKNAATHAIINQEGGR